MEMKYPHLFSPLKIGRLTLRNRIEVAPTSLEDYTKNEYVPRGFYDYYEQKAAGGAAIVTVGESPVLESTGPTQHFMMKIFDPCCMPALTKAADVIHRHGAYASLELSHGGAGSNRMFLGGHTAVSPSGDPNPFTGEETIAMDRAMIDEIVEAFADAALRLKTCGFDMCTVHAGHGWLIGQFLSPKNNHRTDEFGGSYENRIRFLMLVIERIREKCGRDFPIEVRFSGTELDPAGYQLEDAVEFCKLLDGKVELIQVSATSIYDPEGSVICSPNPYEQPGRNVYLAAEIKKHMKKTPIGTLGSLVTPEMMEEIIASGKADVVAAARTFIADPAFAKKALHGREDEIRPCLRCIGCLDDTMLGPQVIRCAVNPIIGREMDLCHLDPVKEKKKVLIAGGGPGGCQAAITAAERGHEVILCEKESELGGNIRFGRYVSFKADQERYRRWLEREVKRLGVDVRLNTAVTPELAAEIAPDVLICAIGSEPSVPPIPGIHGGNVIMATDMHANMDKVGQSVVVIGGGLVGCEASTHLAMSGRNVIVLEMAPRLMPTEPDSDESGATNLRLYTEIHMRESGVKTALGVKVTRLDEKGVYAEKDGKELFFPADTIVVSLGLRPLEAEREALRGVCLDFKPIGDCYKAGKIKDATAAGFAAAAYLD